MFRVSPQTDSQQLHSFIEMKALPSPIYIYYIDGGEGGGAIFRLCHPSWALRWQSATQMGTTAFVIHGFQTGGPLLRIHVI